MKKFLLNWLWQFPQTLLGTILIKILKAEKRTYYYFKNKNRLTAVSLGKIILIPDNVADIDTVIRHEYGHSKQSMMLGWFYLLIIGIYSAVFCNLWDRWFHKKWTHGKRLQWYYGRWSEAWADKLGGVIRNFEEKQEIK